MSHDSVSMPSTRFLNSPSSRRSPLAAIAMAVALAGVAGAQVGTGYLFSQTIGAYTPITGGTQLGVATSTSGATSLDDNYYPVTLPFTFTFDGQPQTSIYVSTNGFLSFGTVSGGSYTPLSSTTAYNGAVSAFGRDLQGGFVFACDRVTGSNVLTNVSAIGPMQVGDLMTGTGIPTGTTITAIAGNQITMSAAATTTGTLGYAGAVGPWSEVRYETLGTAPNQVFVVQWSGFKRYGFTSLTTTQDMELNFQIRLDEATGQMEVVYGNCTPGATTFTTACQVGLRGATNAFPTDVNNRMNTKGVNDDWLLSVAGASNTSGMLFNSVAPANAIANGLTYQWSVGQAATNVSYGSGCYDRAQDSFYDYQSTATAGSTEFANTSLSMTFTGTGYLVMGNAATYVPPSAAATAFTLGDDAEATTPALTLPFPYVGGVAADLTVCSNGFVSVGLGNGTGYSPSAATMLGNSLTGWYTWHDMNPSATGSGSVWFEEVGTVAYITFDGVYSFSGTTAADANTIQYQFDEATGNVNIVFGAVSATGNGWLVGYSTGGANVDPGSISFATALPIVTGPDVQALALSASAPPVFGSTMVYSIDNIPAASPISALLISLGQVNPGVDLGAIGAPGCLQLVDIGSAAKVFMLGAPTITYPLSIPNTPSLAGLPLNAQAASVDLSANALGVITSNGIQSLLGS